MDRVRAFPKEVVRQLDEDLIAALNMIGEGGPEYAAVEEDDLLEKVIREKVTREEAKAKDLH